MSFEGSGGRYKLKSGLLTVSIGKLKKRVESELRKASTPEAQQLLLQDFAQKKTGHVSSFLSERIEDLQENQDVGSGKTSLQDLSNLLAPCVLVRGPLQADHSLRSAQQWQQLVANRAVLLHFFTYCCSNCLCSFPNLAAFETLERQHTWLKVISVHGAKFPHENPNLGYAVQRHSVAHEVIQDKEKKIYSHFGITSWPSYLLFVPLLDLSILYFGSGEESLAIITDIISHTAFREAWAPEDSKLETNHLPLQNNSQIQNNNNSQIQNNNNSQIQNNNNSQIQNNNNNSQTHHAIPNNIETDNKNPHLSFPSGICTGTFTKCKFTETNPKIPENVLLVFVSDSHNHRISIFEPASDFSIPLFTIGRGTKGFQNGNFAVAEFHFPQGLAFSENCLYVADSWNHAVRQVDFSAMEVTSLIGTGEKSGGIIFGGQSGSLTKLALPWDLDFVTFQGEPFLVFSNSNSHQIWCYNFLSKIASRLAGSGIESHRNATSPKISGFAQPSGVCVDTSRGVILVTDSESSSIRAVPLEWLRDHLSASSSHSTPFPSLPAQTNSAPTTQTNSAPTTQTNSAPTTQTNSAPTTQTNPSKQTTFSIVGGDWKNYFNLTCFGDVDGKQDQVRLAHPLGVTAIPGRATFFIADTFNHKIKEIDFAQQEAKTIVTHQTSSSSSQSMLSEPSALTWIPGDKENEISLLVCDTNNHRIHKIALNE